jgi:uncharacterized membrane protein SpoIIM required for sporulation
MMRYLLVFVLVTVGMAALTHGVSQESLSWRDAFIIGSVFGVALAFSVYRWFEVDRKANRRVANIVRLVLGRPTLKNL